MALRGTQAVPFFFVQPFQRFEPRRANGSVVLQELSLLFCIFVQIQQSSTFPPATRGDGGRFRLAGHPKSCCICLWRGRLLRCWLLLIQGFCFRTLEFDCGCFSKVLSLLKMVGLLWLTLCADFNRGPVHNWFPLQRHRLSAIWVWLKIKQLGKPQVSVYVSIYQGKPYWTSILSHTHFENPPKKKNKKKERTGRQKKNKKL